MKQVVFCFFHKCEFYLTGINLRPDGGGGIASPCGFSSLSESDVRSATKFYLPYHCSFLHHVQNFEVCVGYVMSSG